MPVVPLTVVGARRFQGSIYLPDLNDYSVLVRQDSETYSDAVVGVEMAENSLLGRQADEIISVPMSEFAAGVHATTHHDGGSDELSHNALADYDVAKHRIINDGGTSLTELWSADKINAELGLKASLDAPVFTTSVKLGDDVPLLLGTDSDWSLDFDSGNSRLDLFNTTGQQMYVSCSGIDLSAAHVDALTVFATIGTVGSKSFTGFKSYAICTQVGTQSGPMAAFTGLCAIGATGATHSAETVGGNFLVSTTPYSAPTITGDLIGFRGRVEGGLNSTATVTEMVGARAELDIAKLAVTDAVCVDIPAATKGTGSVENLYGLRIAEQTATATGTRAEIMLADAGGIYFRDGSQRIYSSAAATLDFAAATILASDENGNEILKLDGASSAVNYLSVTSGASGDPVILQPLGETNADLQINLDGTGHYNVKKTAAGQNLGIGFYANGRVQVCGVAHSDNYNYAAQFQAYRARGSQASPTPVQDGDFLFTLLGYGRDLGGNPQYPCRVQFIVSDTVTVGGIPSSICFQTGSNIGNIDSAIVCDENQDVSIPNGDLNVDGVIESQTRYDCLGYTGMTGTYSNIVFVGGIAVNHVG